MSLLEVIEIRAKGGNWELLKSQLQDLIIDLKKEKGLNSVKIYKHVMFETDFSIHLFHELDKYETGCSTICSRLVLSLKDFGFVNHRMWIENLNAGEKNESNE